MAIKDNYALFSELWFLVKRKKSQRPQEKDCSKVSPEATGEPKLKRTGTIC
jgi:hypothetical protein